MFVLSSCDKENYVYYIIENQSIDSIRIDYSFFDSFSARIFNVEDSSRTRIINSFEEDTLFIFSVESPKVFNNETADTLIYLYNLEVNRIIDSARTTKNVMLNSNWEFDKRGNHFADFKLVITGNDF